MEQIEGCRHPAGIPQRRERALQHFADRAGRRKLPDIVALSVLDEKNAAQLHPSGSGERLIPVPGSSVEIKRTVLPAHDDPVVAEDLDPFLLRPQPRERTFPRARFPREHDPAAVD